MEVKDVIVDQSIFNSLSYKGDPVDTTVGFDLFREDEQTRLVLTHRGVEGFNLGNDAPAKPGFEQGWRQIVENQLKTFVEHPESESQTSQNRAIFAKSPKVLLILPNTDTCHVTCFKVGYLIYVRQDLQAHRELNLLNPLNFKL